MIIDYGDIVTPLTDAKAIFIEFAIKDVFFFLN